MRYGFYLGQGPTSDLKLLELGVLAERRGFDSLSLGDHFHPFGHRGAKGCGFGWVMIPALAERTVRVDIGTAVTAPILRYNPAIIAQAFATLAVMYPNRIFLGLGAGEAMNEVPVGYDWPGPKERVERLKEAIEVIRLLWTREFVDYEGKYFRLRRANLYTKPEKPPPILLAAHGPRTALMAGKLADGFITANTAKPDYVKSVLIPNVERGLKLANREKEGFRKLLLNMVIYGEDFEEAVRTSRFWAAASASRIPYERELYDPVEIDAIGEQVSDEEFVKSVVYLGSSDDIIKDAEKWIKLGFTEIHFFCLSKFQEEFIDLCGREVLPYLRETYP